MQLSRTNYFLLYFFLFFSLFTFSLENHSFSLSTGSFEISCYDCSNWNENSFIVVTHTYNIFKSLWQTEPGMPFISSAIGQSQIENNDNGNMDITETLSARCTFQTISSFSLVNEIVEMNGSLYNSDGDCNLNYSLTFQSVSLNHLAFSISISASNSPSLKHNRIFLTYYSPRNEAILGFGHQYTYFDMKGKTVSILSREQGIGRGLEPITSILNYFGDGAGGNALTTYTAVPHYITNYTQSFFLENTEYIVFDLTHSTRISVEVYSPVMKGRILNGQSLIELIQEYTRYSGRMKPLPDWISNGAVVALGGGSENVLSKVNLLLQSGCVIAGLWMQDWVGTRNQTFYGITQERLWWNWEVDDKLYPDWNNFISNLKEKYNIRIMTYINPFVVDVSEKPYYHRNLFNEGVTHGYLVKNQSGQVYLLMSGPEFIAGTVDFTNPEARNWYKEIIKTNMIKTGVAGWMADFGEYLPFDSVLYSGIAASYHNYFPVAWAQVVREAVNESGLDDEIVFFSRSAGSKSPGASRLFWLGDQLVTWDSYDGLKTAIISMLSSSISGFALTHSDIGGYTTFDFYNILSYTRSKELLLRWIEMSAFTPVYRTHLGSVPYLNVQVYTDNDTLQHFAFFSKVYKDLASYRSDLMKDHYENGTPIVRSLCVQFPSDPLTLQIIDQFMLGPRLLVAPIVDSSTDNRLVYFPRGLWKNYWTGQIYGNLSQGTFERIDMPLGKPGAFWFS